MDFNEFDYRESTWSHLGRENSTLSSRVRSAAYFFARQLRMRSPQRAHNPCSPDTAWWNLQELKVENWRSLDWDGNGPFAIVRNFCNKVSSCNDIVYFVIENRGRWCRIASSVTSYKLIACMRQSICSANSKRYNSSSYFNITVARR
jgi:hypothetical protein